MKVKPGSSSTCPISPEIISYFSITPGRWLSYVTVIFILIGLIGPNIVDVLPKGKMFVFFSSISIEGSTLVKTIKILSSLIVALGTYLVYRKIPKSE
jgi:hypothetical protein